MAGDSSLRNSLHRRNHKERSQLSHRSRWGLLEKHKDYVLRARDYHAKQDRIKRMKVKASERNKDEFYFAMKNEKTENGVHIKDRGNVALPVDIVKVLKSQDSNYIRTVRASGLKKIAALKAQLTALVDLVTPGRVANDDFKDESEEFNEEEVKTLREAGILPEPSKAKGKGKAKAEPNHIIFVDDAKQAKNYRPSKRAAEAGSSLPERTRVPLELGWDVPDTSAKGKRKLDEDDEEVRENLEAKERGESAKKHRTRLLKELSARLVRDTSLRYALQELETQKLVMGKGGNTKLRDREKVGGDDEDDDDEDQRGRKGDEVKYKPKVFKWKTERKR
ncbi:hypothetical protein BOTBODRAFT_29854 [Botryobasidium botryosum FD-172 SS1]|uniref:U3 small nucleolar RNA-associated protein 11 n=1 Tax=Botryobasidium botryosum (strain FD-172 SS1) TaxID=930990 RepID=A0A067MSK9_BOTB1|nr:hypothetical protein BOTBODRAFT_29854 [Botryobasidium botryosum FD-172 SS1]